MAHDLQPSEIYISARDLNGEEHSICVTDLRALIVIQNGSDEHAATRIYNADQALRLAEAIAFAVRRIQHAAGALEQSAERASANELDKQPAA